MIESVWWMFVVSSPVVLSGEFSATYLLAFYSSMDQKTISFIGLGPHWTLVLVGAGEEERVQVGVL